MKTPKIFTLQEARKSLPYLKSIVADLVRLQKDIAEETDTTSDYYLLLQKNIQVCRNELNSVGCHVKDEKLGLVAFYFKKSQTIGELYWLLGEEDIYYWREISKKNLHFLSHAVKKIESNVMLAKTASFIK